MKIIFTVILTTLLSSQTFAQSTTPRNGEMKNYKGKPVKAQRKVSKEVRVNGKVTTAGCVQSSGRTVTAGEIGYEQCIRQKGRIK